jgi:hypothetical protein
MSGILAAAQRRWPDWFVFESTFEFLRQWRALAQIAYRFSGACLSCMRLVKGTLQWRQYGSGAT